MHRHNWTGLKGALTRWLPVLLMAVTCTALAQEGNAPAEAAEAADSAELTFMQVLEWGGVVGYIIIGLSAVTLMLIGYHLVALRKGVLMPEEAVEHTGALLRDRKLKDALQYTNEENSLFSRIVSAGIGRIRGGWDEMEEIMGDVAEDEAMRLEQTVGYFALIAAVAPLLGLLGTVIGMILAFNQIANEGVVTPADLANPIQQALVTTCFGLIVAIPNVAAFTLFRNRLRRLMVEVSVAVEEVTFPYRGLKPITAAATKQAAARAAAAQGAAAEEGVAAQAAPAAAPAGAEAAAAVPESEGEGEEAPADEEETSDHDVAPAE
jgi:biopolymer transport protein ExbB